MTRSRRPIVSVAGDTRSNGRVSHAGKTSTIKVLATLLRARDEGVPLPACAVCLSPWTDLAGTGESLIANNGRCAMFRPENIPDFARIYLGAVTPEDPYASPVYADLHGLPPLLFQVGDDELLLDDSRRVHDAVRRAGGRSTLEMTAGVFHVWQMLDGFLPEARAALVRAGEFIEKTKGPG